MAVLGTAGDSVYVSTVVCTITVKTGFDELSSDTMVGSRLAASAGSRTSAALFSCVSVTLAGASAGGSGTCVSTLLSTVIFAAAISVAAGSTTNTLFSEACISIALIALAGAAST